MARSVGLLTVPFMVDQRNRPIDFKQLDMSRVEACAKHRRCGVCGKRIPGKGPVAFIGPDDGRNCYANPWMHRECAEQAMEQCPFLGNRRDWRDPAARGDPLLAPYVRMVIRLAPDGRAHKERGWWHFEAVDTEPQSWHDRARHDMLPASAVGGVPADT